MTPSDGFLRDAADPSTNLHGFTLDDLARFTREGSFYRSSSPDFRVLYVGRDDVHSALKYVLSRCTVSLKLNMFGYDDDELDAVIQHLVHDENVYVQGTLDKSQAGGVHEKRILAGWSPEMVASFAVGQSATHQISHTKGGVADGLVAWEGSTNWSASGEGAGIALGAGAAQRPGFKAQNNTCAFFLTPVEVSKFSAELDFEHSVALAQQTQARS